MIDINGIEIKVGMKVKTTQHSGGVFPPSPGTVGTVIIKEYSGEDRMMIRYRKERLSFDSYILLDGQINEVIGE